jgi:hypothetical protein
VTHHTTRRTQLLREDAGIEATETPDVVVVGSGVPLQVVELQRAVLLEDAVNLLLSAFQAGVDAQDLRRLRLLIIVDDRVDVELRLPQGMHGVLIAEVVDGTRGANPLATSSRNLVCDFVLTEDFVPRAHLEVNDLFTLVHMNSFFFVFLEKRAR